MEERAQDEALVFMDIMKGVEQGLVNMFAVGLWHLFEQQAILFHRRELLEPTERDDSKLWTFKGLTTRLYEVRIDIKRFASWQRIEELGLLANTVKHADGTSCRKLKKLRPDLFVPPPRYPGSPVHLGLPGHWLQFQVFQPLSGESVYVSKERFEQYVAAARDFLEELAQRLEGHHTTILGKIALAGESSVHEDFQ